MSKLNKPNKPNKPSGPNKPNKPESNKPNNSPKAPRTHKPATQTSPSPTGSALVAIPDLSTINDEYAIRLYQGLAYPGSQPNLSAPQIEEAGRTVNHGEEECVGIYALSPNNSRATIVALYGAHLRAKGNQAQEALFPPSHQSHYSAPRAVGLATAMRLGHQDVVDALVSVWKTDMASMREVSDPELKNFANASARVLDGSDQRLQWVTVCNWILGHSVRMPGTLTSAPDWLGLYALWIIDEAHKKGEPWAAQWPSIRESIASATRSDILPVRNGLTVERSKTGHLSYFREDHSDKTSGLWAIYNYQTGAITYGVDAPPEKSPLKGVTFVHSAPRPACPGGPGEVYVFPLASG